MADDVLLYSYKLHKATGKAKLQFLNSLPNCSTCMSRGGIIFHRRLPSLLWSIAITAAVFLFLGGSGGTAKAEVHYFDFVLRSSNFTRLCSTKSMLTVNDSFPGPTLTVRKGDTAYVNVYNQGPYGVTIHWHGIKQPRNPWSDGPEYVTQCPILPGTNFTYEVIFTTEEGTLWWHAHSDWTRATVHGAIVILPALGTTYPFQEPHEEKVIVLASWYKPDVMTLMNTALREGGLTALSNAFCIHGEPGDFYPCSNQTTYRLSVDYGKSYLLRIVNSVQNTNMYVSIADHDLTVVGWDGSYVKPLVSRYIMITPGQSMDVLFTANQPLNRYYMISSPFFDGQDDDFDHSVASAIVQYNGNYTTHSRPVYPSHTPGFYDIGSATYFVTNLRSLATPEHPVDVPLEVTHRMYITVAISMLRCPNDSCAGPGGNRLASALNNISFANPSVDVLEAYYRNISGYYETDFPDRPPHAYNFTAEELETDNVTISDQGTKVRVFNYNESVEIVFQGTNNLNSGETHPMHLHGLRFYIIGMGVGNFDNETDPQTYNLQDPPEANTLALPKDGWATIRFRADNPGVWFMHCHFDRHMSWGMNMVFIVKSGGTTATSMKKPPDYMPPCGPEKNSSLLSAIRSFLQQES